jgi:hypothetical protein
MKLSDMPLRIDTPFASSATSDYVRDIPDSTVTPGAASYALGFPPLTAQPIASGGIPPDIKDFNGILRAVTQWTNWLNAGAPVTYDSSFATIIGGYPLGAQLASASVPGKIWRSTANDNLNNPDVTPTGWAPLVSSDSLMPGSVNTAALADGAVTNAKISAGNYQTVKGRAATGSQTDLTMSQLNAMLPVFTGDGGSGGVKGDVPAPASGDAANVLLGSGVWGKVANAALANVATNTVKGRSAAGTGAASDLSMATLTAMLNAFVGDGGSGGTKGLVPAPDPGAAAAGQVLKASGSFGAIDLTLQQMSIGSNAQGFWFQCGSTLVMWGRAILASGVASAYTYPRNFGTIVPGGQSRGWWVSPQRTTITGAWYPEIVGTPTNSQITVQNVNISGNPSGTVNWFVVGDA